MARKIHDLGHGVKVEEGLGEGPTVTSTEVGLGWFLFAEAMLRLWFALTQSEPMGSFLTAPPFMVRTF